MLNQVQNGDAIYVAPASMPVGGFVSGSGYLIGNMFGVAGFTALQTATGVLWVVGVFTLPKLAGQAWTAGQLIYWDSTNKWCTTVAGAFKCVGYATDIAASGAAGGPVRLHGGVAFAATGLA